MMPIVDGLEDEFSEQITVLRMNAYEPENAQLMQTYGLQGHPSFALVDSNGRTSQLFFGPQSEETLRTAINEIIP